MKPLTLEQWLATYLPYTKSTREEYIDLQLAESGTDREADFDLEIEQLVRYEAYLGSLDPTFSQP